MKKLVLSLSIIAFLVSCGGSDSVEVVTPKESVENNNEVSGEELKIDLSASVLKWKGSKLVSGEHHGTINFSAGTIKVANGAVVGGNAVIDMNSMTEVDVGSEEYATKLINHLKSDHFFKVDTFPTAELNIVSVSDGSVTADLTILGTTQQITFPATISVSQNGVDASASFAINRTDWGIVYGSGSFSDLAKDKVINDEIEFEVALKAVK